MVEINQEDFLEMVVKGEPWNRKTETPEYFHYQTTMISEGNFGVLYYETKPDEIGNIKTKYYIIE